VSKEMADFDQPGYPIESEEFDSILLAEIDMAPCSMEPPKEKPPPPPVESELSDDDVKEEPAVKLRGDTSKNVKKELLKRRSDFLGINLPDDDESEPDEQVIQPPPAIEELLVSERELQRQQRLQLQSDLLLKNQGSEETESLLSIQRSKSQTELDTRNLPQHQRQYSYPDDQSLEEDEEIARKEREIIENLEREERNQQEIDRDEQELSIADQPICVMEEDERIRRLQEERRRMSEERTRREEQRIRLEEESQFSDKKECSRQAMFEDDSKSVNPTDDPVFQSEHSYQFVQPQWKGDLRTTVPSNVSSTTTYQKIWSQRDNREPSVRDNYVSHSPTEDNVWARGEMIRASRKPQGLDHQPFGETLNVNGRETVT
ncbi:uncharacterized protein KIAA1211 homolog, partial [Limulus polyphemus]|uniref:Uncharacterized protein KIAA1211 homolog n=1 Tax=Limulus polyphemus TaxID=6850 RepID=A0ABM1C1W0_LIMPO